MLGPKILGQPSLSEKAESRIRKSSCEIDAENAVLLIARDMAAR